jgi:hypothetical protein
LCRPWRHRLGMDRISCRPRGAVSGRLDGVPGPRLAARIPSVQLPSGLGVSWGFRKPPGGLPDVGAGDPPSLLFPEAGRAQSLGGGLPATDPRSPAGRSCLGGLDPDATGSAFLDRGHEPFLPPFDACGTGATSGGGVVVGRRSGGSKSARLLAAGTPPA